MLIALTFLELAPCTAGMGSLFCAVETRHLLMSSFHSPKPQTQGAVFASQLSCSSRPRKVFAGPRLWLSLEFPCMKGRHAECPRSEPLSALATSVLGAAEGVRRHSLWSQTEKACAGLCLLCTGCVLLGRRVRLLCVPAGHPGTVCQLRPLKGLAQD